MQKVLENCHHGSARVHPVHLMNISQALDSCRPLDQASQLEPIDPPKLASMVQYSVLNYYTGWPPITTQPEQTQHVYLLVAITPLDGKKRRVLGKVFYVFLYNFSLVYKEDLT